MAIKSRKIIRKKIAELLGPVVATAGASETKSYQPSTIGATPGVYVRTTSSDRPPLTVRGKATRFEFDILLLVLQSDKKNPNWTEDKAEDLLDDLEAAVCEFMTTYRVVADYWDSIEYARPSKIEHFYEEGLPYLLEAIPVEVEGF